MIISAKIHETEQTEWHLTIEKRCVCLSNSSHFRWVRMALTFRTFFCWNEKTRKPNTQKVQLFRKKPESLFFGRRCSNTKPKLFSILKVFRISHPCKQQLSNSNNRKKERFIRDRWDWLLPTVFVICWFLTYLCRISYVLKEWKRHPSPFWPAKQTIAHISLIHAHIHT